MRSYIKINPTFGKCDKRQLLCVGVCYNTSYYWIHIKMYGKESYPIDDNIVEPWFDEIDKINQYHQDLCTEDYSRNTLPNKKLETISLNSTKYYSLPCNCGLVENISIYQKLRTQIYFDVYTQNFYKSDINSTLILPNGLPYMNCPRHSQYFSDVIRLHTNSTKKQGNQIQHQKIMLFDCNSYYNNYATSNRSYLINHEDDDENVLQDNEPQPVESTPDRYNRHSPNYLSKHFPLCPTYQDERNSCNCEEHVSTIRQNYIRENSVVADVLGDYGIDVVIPPQDFHMINNPLLKNQSNTGARLAKARWVRRNDRFGDSCKSNDNSIYCRDKSMDHSRKSFIDSTVHDPTNMYSINVNTHDYSNNYNRNSYHPNKPTISVYDMMNDDQDRHRKNATFTVYTKPRRHHSENDDFCVETSNDRNNSRGKNLLYGGGDSTNTYSVLHSKSNIIPEDDLERWITIIGFQPRFIGQIIRYMNSFGPILKIKTSKTCNYMHLMYSRVDSANNAVQKATINVDNSMIVSIKPCSNTYIPNQQVQCFDIDKDDNNSFDSTFNVTNYFSWISSAISKIVGYVDEFINEP